jgi:hypothetical protein
VEQVALQQRRDALTVRVAHRDVQEKVTVPERPVVDRQGGPVVAEPLQGSDDPGSEPVVAAILIQDACSLLTAQDLHRGDVDCGRFEVGGDGGICGLSVSRPTTLQLGWCRK